MSEPIPIYVHKEESIEKKIPQHPHVVVDDKDFDIKGNKKVIYAIKLLIDSIEMDNHELLKSVFRSLPINSMDRDGQDILMKTLITFCLENQRSEALEELLYEWSDVYPTQQRVPLELEVCSNPYLTNDEILFILESTRFDDIVYCIDGFSEGADSETIYPLLSKIIDILNPEEEEISLGIKQAEHNDNWSIVDFLVERLRGKTKYAPIPEWIKDYIGDDEDEGLIGELELCNEVISAIIGNDLDLITDVEDLRHYFEIMQKIYKQVPDRSKTKEHIEFMFDLMDVNNLSIINEEDAKWVMELRASIADSVDYQELFYPLYQEEKYEKDEKGEWLSRTFGPDNQIIITDDEVEHSRMFVELDNDEDGSSIRWFTGSCDSCFEKIREYWHCVRLPKEGGGWEGSYCSWNCTRKNLTNSDRDKERSLMIDYFETQTIRLGIQDRISDGDSILAIEIED